MNDIISSALQGELLSRFGIIDFHVHVGKWSGLHIIAPEPEEILRKARVVGVARIVVNGVIYPDLSYSNNLVGAFVRKYPDSVVGLAVTNPYQHDMADEVRRCFEEFGFRGLKLHALHEGAQSPYPLESYHNQWERLFSFLSERRAPVLYHGVITEEMIRSWPDIPFVMAHGVGSPAQMMRLSKYPNFYVDTASTQNPAFAVSRAVEILGRERVLWGTDAPWDDFAQRLGVVLDSGLPEPDMLAILRDNAARLLTLDN